MKLNIKVISNGGNKVGFGQPCPWIVDVPPEAEQK
jgi:hypothetical protein